MKKWSSFAVKSPTEIIHEASHPMGGDRTSFVVSILSAYVFLSCHLSSLTFHK